jgi:translation initiation factor IF-2
VNIHRNVSSLALHREVSVKTYSIIYELIDDVKAEVSKLLDPIRTEEFTGRAIVREVFNISNMGKIAGSYANKGYLERGYEAKVMRDNNIICTGLIKTLKRSKDDVKQVKEGYECGILVENYSDIQIGDIIESYKIIITQQKI